MYAPLELIDAGALAAACDQPWWNQTLCKVNDSVARIGVFHGEFHSSTGRARRRARSC